MGLVSSHFFFLRRQVKQPDLDLLYPNFRRRAVLSGPAASDIATALSDVLCSVSPSQDTSRK